MSDDGSTATTGSTRERSGRTARTGRGRSTSLRTFPAMSTASDPRPFRLPAILLGIGLGGLFDAFLLHDPTPEAGYLVVFAALAVIAAVLLWRARQRDAWPSTQFI